VAEKFHHNLIRDRVQGVNSLDLLRRIAKEKTIGRKALRRRSEKAEEYKRDRRTTEKKVLFRGAEQPLRVRAITRASLHMTTSHTIQEARKTRQLEEPRTKLCQALLTRMQNAAKFVAALPNSTLD